MATSSSPPTRSTQATHADRPLHLPVGVRLAARAWRGTAAEVGAAAALLSAADPRGLAPDAAAAVARLVGAWAGAVGHLGDDLEAHAIALDDTVLDLADADAATAQALTGVLGLTAAPDGSAGGGAGGAGGGALR